MFIRVNMGRYEEGGWGIVVELMRFYFFYLFLIFIELSSFCELCYFY